MNADRPSRIHGDDLAAGALRAARAAVRTSLLLMGLVMGALYLLFEQVSPPPLGSSSLSVALVTLPWLLAGAAGLPLDAAGRRLARRRPAGSARVAWARSLRSLTYAASGAWLAVTAVAFAVSSAVEVAGPSSGPFFLERGFLALLVWPVAVFALGRHYTRAEQALDTARSG